MATQKTNISIINKTKGKLPSLPFVTMKDEILGEAYSLSIAYVSEKVSQELNKKFRNKNNPTNILSFPLDKKNGEIILCPTLIKKEAKENTKGYDKNFTEWLGFLVIHGMLHLKGMQHSDRMEREETKYDEKYRSRNRRRLHDDESRSGRVHKRRKKS